MERTEYQMNPQEQEGLIAQAKNRAIMPALEAIADEIEERARNGKLKKELKKLKVSNIIHNLTKIISAIKANSPVIIIPTAAASDNKDPHWFKAHSAVDKTPITRRRAIHNAEVIDAKKEMDSSNQAGQGSPSPESPKGGGDGQGPY